VRTGSAHALVEKDLSSLVIDPLRQFNMMFKVEACELRVRSPDQSTNGDTTVHTLFEYIGEGDFVDEPFIGVTPPVRERDRVAAPGIAQRPVERLEVWTSVHKQLNAIACGPSVPIAASPVDAGGHVAAFTRREEPSLVCRIVRHRSGAYPDTPPADRIMQRHRVWSSVAGGSLPA
jgi:hypothetical protein